MVALGVERWQARLVSGLLDRCDGAVYARRRPDPSSADHDLTVAYEIVELSRVASPGAQALSLTAQGHLCVVGSTSAGCFDGQTSLGVTTLPALVQTGLALQSMGPFLVVPLVGAGSAVLDVRSQPSVVGWYPTRTGASGLSGSEWVTLDAGGSLRSTLARPFAAPTLSLTTQTQATPGERVALGAQLSSIADVWAGYTAELYVQGQLAASFDSVLPGWVDLPSSGSSATVQLVVRDDAGHRPAGFVDG